MRPTPPATTAWLLLPRAVAGLDDAGQSADGRGGSSFGGGDCSPDLDFSAASGSGLGGSGDGNASMLLCDKCSCGFHMYCLSPPLHAVPAGEWLCSACLQESFGFGSGRVFKYHQYERQAHAFKQSFFAELFETEAARLSKKSKSAAMAAAYSAEERSRIAARLTELEVPPEEVEWQFWNIVTTPSKSLEVLYGSDLPVISL